MLRFIVFTCGAALMGLEMVAARVLAPYLGNSIYVWGAVISTVMIALSIGYALGGQIADRFGAARALPPVIAGAGLATVAAPLVAGWVLPVVADLGPRLGSLVAAAAIYFLPSILLAMVSPLGVRIAAQRGLAHIGRSAGGLYAISTAGSIVGTLGTSFWLIPLLSIAPLVVRTGVLLLATALAALLLQVDLPSAGSENSRVRAAVARLALPGTIAITLAAVALGTFVLWEVAPVPATNEQGEAILFRADTQYHRVTVTESEGERHLRFDRSHQSAVSIADPYTSSIRYPDYMHLALALKPDPDRVLVLGLGGGSITKRFWRDYPGVLVDPVGIDPVGVRRYVQRTGETYDIVVVDAYYSDSLPYHLVTEEFFREVEAIMAPDGVLAYNVIASPEGEQSELFRSMYRTASGVWDDIWVFPIGYGYDYDPTVLRNIIVLATDTRLPQSALFERIMDRVGGQVTIKDFEAMAGDLYTSPVSVADVPLLTDSHAPVDSLIKVQ